MGGDAGAPTLKLVRGGVRYPSTTYLSTILGPRKTVMHIAFLYMPMFIHLQDTLPLLT
ncbi:hypothetical protein A2U01_0006208 [Trifolium medium]|uniref:Uncharacterized protein n=1 Tax=Trifolium medium TaxID=97028 RepID=A0A392MDY8_9FABA|nr:hypothetical protein [Trifolium medium]